MTLAKTLDVTRPVAWIGSGIVVYRVGNGSAPADYAVAANDATAPHKITDAIDVAGLTPGE
ncbi:MAG TPA: hypothetical protein VKQ34_00695 [Candidatus Saccharimonadales bacterium]|nr:hypothetical protein [Candidatus Saccharimonadales bacterium]